MNNKIFREWVFYDGACPMWTHMAYAAKKMTAGQDLGFASLQSDWVKEKTKNIKDPMKEMGAL